MKSAKANREFLKTHDWEELHLYESDQSKKIPRPAPQKPIPDDAELIDLVAFQQLTVGDLPLREVIAKRQSRRKYTHHPLNLDELSFLLWATQGVRTPGRSRQRSVPSGGGRHSFETYLYLDRVANLQPGLYRYLPLEHRLLFLYAEANLMDKIVLGCYSQKFVNGAAVVFIWTTIPYRAEWRYSIVSHKMIAQDAGHLCQNLYLASEAIGAGTCAVGAYHQGKMDDIVKVDGEDEFVVYVAPVGKIKS
ncbi:MAG: SagB/ThcOx family dehydrogenase [Proteobacteria bacterium]|nr:SagB/ThcOx family dehydrogenase [Pseudomonadota bacterium]